MSDQKLQKSTMAPGANTVQALPSHFPLQLKQQSLCEIVDKGLVFLPSCLFSILHITIRKVFDWLIGTLQAALQAGYDRGLGLTISALQLTLKVGPVSKLLAMGPAPGRTATLPSLVALMPS
jgi:hypothetical protein